MTELNVWLQSIGGPALNQLFLLLTNLAHPLTISMAAILIYWCFHKEKGVSAALAVTTSVGLNTVLKLLLHIPRPYTYDLRIRPLDTLTAPGSSFPSNHAQSIAAFLASICLSFRHAAIISISAVICLVVALSRLYLGVHTIVDVTAGLALGILWACVIFFISQKIIKTNKSLLLMFPAVLLLLLIFFRHDDLCKMAGICLGFVAGYLLDERYIRFSPSPYIRVKLADAVLGLTAVGAVKLFTMLVFPNTILFALLEYCLTGFVVSFICPYCFHRINHKLSPRRPNKTARLP